MGQNKGNSNGNSFGGFGEALKLLVTGVFKAAMWIVVFVLKIATAIVSKIAEFIESRLG